MTNTIRKLGLAGIVAGAIGAVGLVGNLAFSQNYNSKKSSSVIPFYRVDVSGKIAYELPMVEGGYDVFSFNGEKMIWEKLGEINPPKRLVLMFVQKKKSADSKLENKLEKPEGKMPPAYIKKPHPYEKGVWITRINPDYVNEIQNMVPGEIVEIEPGYMAVYKDKNGKLIHFSLPKLKPEESLESVLKKE